MLSEREQNYLNNNLGWDRSLLTDESKREQLHAYLGLKLASAGLLPDDYPLRSETLGEFTGTFLHNLREANRQLSGVRAPVDKRIESFLGDFLSELSLAKPLTLPTQSLALDRYGMARELSLPAGENRFRNDYVESTRVHNGVVHNPRFDRRTTAGTFHVVEGGPAISGDKRAVPKTVFARLFEAAMRPTDELMTLPFTATNATPSRCFVSLLLRPLVCPEVPGYCEDQSLEVRFFVPGSLISNLDFVESIFGNAGNPLDPANDAGLDIRHWTGHTGCVILAPQMESLTKKELGLPHIDEATERQRRDRMCWESEDELYNDGVPFKVVCRGDSGVVVTLISDNYFGYCKKEVKSQISYAANLMGGVEEEHAGGAIAFASYNLGEEFQVNSRLYNKRTFGDVSNDYAEFMHVQPEGYGIDRQFEDVIYIPEDTLATLRDQSLSWQKDGQRQSIPLLPDKTYIAPSGYKIRLEKHPAAPSWRIVGTVGEGVLCHKPCTVSGGGKSEISKSLNDYMLYGPIFVSDVEKDFELLEEIFERDYTNRWKGEDGFQPDYSLNGSRKVLAPERSLGSVIKLLTPSPDYTSEYNDWLSQIPNHIYAMVFIIKRFISPDQVDNWKKQFGVEIVNGELGHELKHGNRKLVGTYLKVGLENDQWRTFKLRQDFIASEKVQVEDDISASVVVPKRFLGPLGPAVAAADSYKFTHNCEYRLFQRPDDAIHRGLDKQTESDISRSGNFLCNFQPLEREELHSMLSNTIQLSQFTQPMQQMLLQSDADDTEYTASSDQPRIVNGKPTKNPRYLQDRPDLIKARETYVAEMGTRLHRAIPANQPVHIPVSAILSGRRNNPPEPDKGIPQLAVYSPLHYQELPELFMDFVCSLTGKSPSTTGFGSEGALTKGPFNNMPQAIDLNDALVSMILTNLRGFSTPAGHIGPEFQVGHDISMLIPEIWCRLGPDERDPVRMIEEGLLEQVEDFQDSAGNQIAASRLGYRITYRFVRRYFGRVFDNPAKVFHEEVLRPELQDREAFAEGMRHIVEMQRKVAQSYFDDGTWKLACPPLQALLSIMAKGDWHGHTLDSPTVRQLFTRENLISSEWYRNRLLTRQQKDIRHWQQCVEYLDAFGDRLATSPAMKKELDERKSFAASRREDVSEPDYLDQLAGTLGADPMVEHVAEPDSTLQADAAV